MQLVSVRGVIMHFKIKQSHILVIERNESVKNWN